MKRGRRMTRLIVEGWLTSEQASAVADAVNNHYSGAGLIRAEAGKRLASAGGVDAGLVVALANLVINLAGFAIKLHELRAQHRLERQRAGAELSKTDRTKILEPLEQGSEGGFRLLRDDGLGGLLAAQDGACTLTFSPNEPTGSGFVIARVRTTADVCAVFLETDPYKQAALADELLKNFKGELNLPLRASAETVTSPTPHLYEGDAAAASLVETTQFGWVIEQHSLALCSAKPCRFIADIERVADNNTRPILLLEPTGAGKSELVIRILGLRRERGPVTGQFIYVHCAMIQGDGGMATLLENVKCAVKGTINSSVDVVRAADEGLLFLDEIEGRRTEGKTLRVRESDTIRWKGRRTSIQSVAEYHLIKDGDREMDAAVRSGALREDLPTRIKVCLLTLPGLADRRKDIDPNLGYELNRWFQPANRRVRLSERAKAHFSEFAEGPEANWTDTFQDFHWAAAELVGRTKDGISTLEVGCGETSQFRSRWMEGVHRGADEFLSRAVSVSDFPH